ncbi:site-specific recombinase XerD [Paraburkholderia sp. EB58]|jgi:hypothetical protein
MCIASAEADDAAMLRAYYTGMSVRKAVERYLPDRIGAGQSARGDHWLKVVGKGRKVAKVALPPLARTALDRHLVERRLSVTPSRWRPDTPLIASLAEDGTGRITSVRLWSVLQRFFAKAADIVEADSPLVAQKLRQASPHWMRHYVPFLTMSGKTIDRPRRSEDYWLRRRRAQPLTRHSFLCSTKPKSWFAGR